MLVNHTLGGYTLSLHLEEAEFNVSVLFSQAPKNIAAERCNFPDVVKGIFFLNDGPSASLINDTDVDFTTGPLTVPMHACLQMQAI